jgi:hypothetical protein
MPADTVIEIRGSHVVDVRAGTPGRPQSNIVASATEPSDPEINDLWVDLS